MIAHTSIPVRRYSVSKTFYRQVLGTLGYKNNMEFGRSAGFYDGKNTDFWIAQKKTVIPLHVAFRARGRKQVEAFYKAALAAGSILNPQLPNDLTQCSMDAFLACSFLGSYHTASMLWPSGSSTKAAK